MNCALIVQIDQVRFKPALFNWIFPSQQNDSIFNLHIQGLKFNIMIRDELNNWAQNKMELLRIIELIRNKLIQTGKLPDASTLKSQTSQHLKQEDGETMSPSWRKILGQMVIVADDINFNFLVYSMAHMPEAHRNIDETNSNQFVKDCLSDACFMHKNICFNVYVPNCECKFLRTFEEEFELKIQGAIVYLTHPTQLAKKSFVNDVQITLKVPTNLKLIKDICNFEMQVLINDGVLNLSKKFLKSFIRFFVFLDTLLTVIKQIRRLISKQNYQDMLVYERMRSSRRNQEIAYSNYKDPVFPKRFQVIIKERLQAVVTDSSQSLNQFLARSNSESTEVVYMRFCSKSAFEMVRTLKNSYIISFLTERFEMQNNYKPVLIAEKISQEINFTFQKEINEIPVKKSRLECTHIFSIQTLALELCPGLLKTLNEVINFYKWGLHTASIKHKIIGLFQDRQFLIQNIISSTGHQESWLKLTDDQIIEIYETDKHIDTITQQIKIEKTKSIHSSLAIYSEQSQVTKSFAHDLILNMNKFEFNICKEKGTINSSILVRKLKIEPMANKAFANDAKYELPKYSMPLLKVEMLSYEAFTQLQYAAEVEQQNRKVHNKRTKIKRLQLNVDFELVLDRMRDWLDYTFIIEHFSSKWKNKYFVDKEQIQRSMQSNRDSRDAPQWLQITEGNNFYLQDAMLLWQLSTKRLASLRVVNFRPIQEQSEPSSSLIQDIFANNHEFSRSRTLFKDSHQTQFAYKAQTAEIFHKYIQTPDKNSFPKNQAKTDLTSKILECKQPQWHNKFKKGELEMKFMFDDYEMTLMHDFYFCGVINEFMKQSYQSIALFKAEYLEMKRKQNNGGVPLQPANEPWQTSFSFFWKKAQFAFQEDPLKQLFVNKNDIAESLQDRDILMCKPQMLYQTLKKLKAHQVFGNCLVIDMLNAQFTFKVPKKFLKSENLFEKIRMLDEADMYLTPDLFELIKGKEVLLRAGYCGFGGRSFHKPALELFNIRYNLESIHGHLNSSANPGLFQERIQKKIFDRFAVSHVFNKITNKWYYDADVSIDKLIVNIQGQSCLQLLKEIGSQLERLTSFQDRSNSYNTQKTTKLPIPTGFDSLRFKNHGLCKFQIKNAEITIYPKRLFNRFTESLSVQFSDLEYNKQINSGKNQNRSSTFPQSINRICVRSILISKNPLKQYEALLINIPLIELSVCTNFNHGKSINHYQYLKAVCMDSYLNYLQEYTAKDLYLELKINVPSFGHINQTRQNSLYLPQLLQSYCNKSPVPLIHWQRSYMKFIDDLLKEYVNGGKVDVSAIVLNNKILKQSMLKKNQDSSFVFKVCAYLQDALVLFSDFDETHECFKETILENQYIEPNQIEDDTPRDEYLKRYQGLIMAVENLCVKTNFQAKKGSEFLSLDATQSKFVNDFFKLSAINSDSLYKIRDKRFESQRQANWPKTMENYQYFQHFFELDQVQNPDPFLTSETLLNGFKTLFPQYILRNEQLQHLINSATGLYETQNVKPFNLFQSKPDDFGFKETDTIIVLERCEYKQNQPITFKQHYDKQNMSQEQLDKFEKEEFIVCHLIEVKNARILYTKKVHELILHHLVRGFNFSKYRKTDYIDTEQRNIKTSDFLKSYEPTSTKSLTYNTINIENLKKVAYIALRLIKPQVNLQNEISKSQVLMATELPTTAIIFTYFAVEKNQNCFELLNIQKQLRSTVIKTELCFSVEKFDLYVAPTYINIDSPTYWVWQSKDESKSDEVQRVFSNYSEQIFYLAPDTQQTQDQRENKQENVLRKMVTLSNTNIKFEFLTEELADYINPKLLIDIYLQKVLCEMDGANLWSLMSVFKTTLFSRGQKTQELIQTEEAKERVLNQTPSNELKEIIDAKVKAQMHKFGNDGIKPIMARLVSYTIEQGEFTFENQAKKFASSEVEGLRGKHMIYSSRDSKNEFDVDSVTLQNFVDNEQYRLVLHPKQDGSRLKPQTMVKIRTRDKYIIVDDAPWRVFDQFEVFIFPTTINFTKNFYQQFKRFFFENNLNKNEQDDQIKKYELLVPNNLHKKQKSPFKKQETKVEQTLEQKKNISFPSFYRYMRINEISVSITYFHGRNHLLNISNFQLKMPAFICHGYFQPFKKQLELYEKHVKYHFIKQIPNLIKQKALTARQNVATVIENVEKGQIGQVDEFIVREEKLAQQKRLLFGDLA